MSKHGLTRKLKRAFSKMRGQMAFYFRRNAQEQQRIATEQQALQQPAPTSPGTMQPSPTRSSSPALQRGPGQSQKNWEDWVKDRRGSIRKGRADMEQRFSMATSGGGFRGR